MSTNYLKDKKVAILGLGREGLSTLKFLKKNKIKPDVLDIKNDPKGVRKSGPYGAGKNYLDRIADYDLVFRTPGFPRLHPKLLAAEKKGIRVSSNTKLFFDLCPAKIIGITGTKGKTTTTFLIYEILKSKFGKKVFIAGNFGKPALDILPKLTKKSLVVLELSSFQLQDLSKSPDVAVITNISIDHMDSSGKFGPATHQTEKEYFNAKINIVKHQKMAGLAVINKILKNKTKKIGRGKKIYCSPSPVQTKLLGTHNLENIALAVEVGKIFNVPKQKIIKAVKDFKGVKHRLEFVKKINDISFYNDSAATNPDATLAALKSFKESLHIILGGSDKGLDYRKLARFILKSKNIKSAALIGQIKNTLYKLIGPKKSKKIKTLKDAVLYLFKKSGKNEVVLLSPAAASFDMFESYAHRGKEFKKIVNRLRR